MKKLSILSLITLFFVQIGFAQSDEFVMTWPIVVSEVKKADASVENPKKAAVSTTWMELGRKYLQLYTFDIKNIQNVRGRQDAMVLFGNPKTQSVDSMYTVFNYDRVTLFFKNDELKRYERTGDAKQYFPEHSTALDKAAAAYLKAKELDNNGKQNKKINDQLNAIIDFYSAEGYYFYAAQDYKNAAKYYGKVGDMVAKGVVNLTNEERATKLNACGTVEKLAENYTKAIEFFNKAIELSPKISFYGEVYDSKIANSDTTGAINTLMSAIDAFPNDSLTVTYTNMLINTYIQSNQIDQALTYLNKALEKDPTNVIYLYNKGALYKEKGQIEEAKAAYLKALTVNENDADSNLGLGLVFTAAAKAKQDAADLVWKDKKTYNALVAESEALWKQAIPYLEKYASVTTNSYQAYKDLRNIYHRLGMTKEEQIAQQKMDEALNRR